MFFGCVLGDLAAVAPPGSRMDRVPVEVSSPALLGTARRRLQEPAFLEACTPEDSARLVTESARDQSNYFSIQVQKRC